MLSNESYTRLLAQFYCKWVALLLSIVLKDALRYELWRGPPQFCGKNGLDYDCRCVVVTRHLVKCEFADNERK